MTRPIPGDLTVIQGFYERCTPFEDRKREISEDLKELFAELKATGLTPKAARIAFAEQYRIDNQTADQAAKRNESDEEVELYLSALARVRESDADDEPASAVGGEGNDRPPQAVAVLPANQSTAVRMDVQGKRSDSFAEGPAKAPPHVDGASRAAEAAGTQAPPVDTHFPRIRHHGVVR